MRYTSKEAVIENLKDAGCGPDTIADFMQFVKCGEVACQLSLLSRHRDRLLDSIHRDEARIACLDYLIYQIKQNNVTNQFKEGS